MRDNSGDNLARLTAVSGRATAGRISSRAFHEVRSRARPDRRYGFHIGLVGGRRDSNFPTDRGAPDSVSSERLHNPD